MSLFDDDLVESLVKLGKAAERVQDARSKAVPSESEDQYEPTTSSVIRIKYADLLDFDGSYEPVRADRLLRIIDNSAQNAARVHEFVSAVTSGNAQKIDLTFSAAVRYSATLYRGLDSFSKLIGAREHSLLRRRWRSIPQTEDEVEDTVVSTLTKAYIYERIKNIKSNMIRQVYNIDETAAEMDNLLEEIRNDTNTE